MMTPSSLVQPIPPERQASRTWRVIVDGRPVEPVTSVAIAHDSYGTLTYGLTPAGHDGWSFHEAGGGGSVIVPYCVAGGVVLVGLVRQQRHLQGGVVLNVPRGFIDPGEDHLQAARRELEEETGLDGRHALEALAGAPANPNSSFFDTASPGEGIRFYAVEIPLPQLEPTAAGLRLREQPGSSRAGRLAEHIGDAVFIPWHEAAQVADMFTNAAVARLLAHLGRDGAGSG